MKVNLLNAVFLYESPIRRFTRFLNLFLSIHKLYVMNAKRKSEACKFFTTTDMYLPVPPKFPTKA